MCCTVDFQYNRKAEEGDDAAVSLTDGALCRWRRHGGKSDIEEETGMKVGENISLYAGTAPQNAAAAGGAEKNKEQRKTIFAGDLNQGNTLQDRIAQRKAQAQKEAMKIVGDAFAGELSVDEGVEESRRHIDSLQEEKKQLQEEAATIDAGREKIEKAYEAGEISEEDYQAELKDFYQRKQESNKSLAENESGIMGENAVIRGTKLERLKHNPMGKAQNVADAVMEAASGEIVSMVMDEAKEKIDEESEKREEQAEKIEEKREEKEELIEKQKEHREEKEALLEEMPVEEVVSLSRTQTDIRQEVQEILDKMKLLAEDLKGAKVDETL